MCLTPHVIFSDAVVALIFLIPFFLISVPQRLTNQIQDPLLVFKAVYLSISLHLKTFSVAAGVFFTTRWEFLLPVLFVDFLFEVVASV